jgi:hypothetical protein
MSNKSQLDIFLNSLAKSLGSLESKEFWPLNPTQMLAYYDADFLLDFYLRYQHLKKKKTKKQIAELFENSDFLIDFLVNFAAVGFKVLEQFNIYKVSFTDREAFFNEMFQLMKIKDGNLFSLSRTEPAAISRLPGAKSKDFIKPTEDSKRVFNEFRVSLFGLNWSYYYDLFAVFGSTSHWPVFYKYKNINYLLIVDEYYNQRPTELWPKSKTSPVQRVTIYRLFRPFKFKQNVFGRLSTKENINDKMEFYQVVVDGKVVKSAEKMQLFKDQIMKTSSAQTKYVERLKPLKQVEKAIEMSYYSHRKFFGSNWKKYFQTVSRRSLKMFGDKFIKQESKNMAGMSLTAKRKTMDPRNNEF